MRYSDVALVFALTAVFVTLPGLPVRAETYYVDDDSCPGLGAGTPADPYCSIQSGIDDADWGDTVQVAAGTYIENITMKDGVVVQGAGAGENPELHSIIDGDENGTVVTAIDVDADATLDGFLITNGDATEGGGMYNSNSSPTVSNCTFSANDATVNGGGGMYNTNSSPTVSNCIFSGNSAQVITGIGNGAGMFNLNSSPTVSDCTFSANVATGDGGGMYNAVSSPTVTNCTFTGNSADAGGGMYNVGSFPVVTSCTFSGNSSAVWTRGGGMVNDNSSPTVNGCYFVNNVAGTHGGGMYNEGSSSPVVANCIFHNNMAGDGDGRDMANLTSSAPPTVINSTFKSSGHSSMYNVNCSPIVTNSIFWGGQFDMIWNWGTASPVVTYCNIEQGTGLYPGVGNINADPMFVDESNGDFRLRPFSPCIDAGDATDPALPATDYDGDDRRIDDPTVADTGYGSPPVVDIGADEFDPSGFVFVDGFESGNCTEWSTTVGEVP